MLWLIGMMGAGKTTVGLLVADLLGVSFVDLDSVIEATSGMSVPEIFAQEGEAGFRAREVAAVRAVRGAAGVVATGGGVVVSPQSIDEMRESGTVVWLEASIAELTQRSGAGPDRRLLIGPDVESRLRQLLAARAEAYEAAAHARVDTNGRTPASVAEEVATLWPAS